MTKSGKITTITCAFAAALLMASIFGSDVKAAEKGICDGIYVQEINLSGMTLTEAENAVNAYVESLKDEKIVLYKDALLEAEDTEDAQETEANESEEDALEGLVNGQLEVSAGDLGLHWANPEVLAQAAGYGRSGNVVKRYKEQVDLQSNPIVLALALDFNQDVIEDVLEVYAEEFHSEPVNAKMHRENDEFVYEGGDFGRDLNLADSAQAIYLAAADWAKNPAGCDLAGSLVFDEVEPEASIADLQEIQDLLGTYTTNFSSSGGSRSANVRNATRFIDGTILYPGEEFSTLSKITPFTIANGYQEAAGYAGGKVVPTIGGGICQVSTTLYNAVLLAELEVTNRRNHAMVVGYVPVGMDATIAESSGIDFTFVNNTEYPIYIEAYTTDNKRVVMNIYGKETRDPNHSVEYVNEITDKTVAQNEIIYTDPSRGLGYYDIQPAHTGYVANVYKITYENGVQVSKEQITHSSYTMTPRSVTVGTAISDPKVAQAVEAAMASGSIDHVMYVIQQIQAGLYQFPGSSSGSGSTTTTTTESQTTETTTQGQEAVETEATTEG